MQSDVEFALKAAQDARAIIMGQQIQPQPDVRKILAAMAGLANAVEALAKAHKKA